MTVVVSSTKVKELSRQGIHPCSNNVNVPSSSVSDSWRGVRDGVVVVVVVHGHRVWLECEVKAWGYRIPSMKLVSSRWMSTRMKDISLRVFSKITLGSSDRQRRQLGAMTMARLFTSILVMATLTGCANTYRQQQAHSDQAGVKRFQ